MAIAAAKGRLIAVIGDEVILFTNHSKSLLFNYLICTQDTCVGFLLGGIGEMNKNRQPNFMVVDKSIKQHMQSKVMIVFKLSL